jgi:hypothetical protein
VERKLRMWCAECGIDPARDICTYMLRDELWATIAHPHDNLCLECAEKRLGRQLLREDFTAGPRQERLLKRWPSPFPSLEEMVEENRQRWGHYFVSEDELEAKSLDEQGRKDSNPHS